MAEDAGAVREKIRQFILEAARYRGVKELADEEPLIENGALDSLGIFRLAGFLEDTFQFRIADEEITPENFRTIRAIAHLVGAKLKAKNGQG